MIGFLLPIALAGLALLAIPLVLHIFKPRRVRMMPFSSLRWLRASQHRMSRRIRWHQVFLLMLRMALIVLLVLALAGPVFSPREAAGRSDRFVLLDLGPSMGYLGIDPTTPIERAKDAVREILAATAPGDRTTVIGVGGTVQLLGMVEGGDDIHLSRLESVQPGPVTGGFGDALSMVGLLAGSHRAAERVELYIVGDADARKWSQGMIARFNEASTLPTEVQWIDVSPAVVENAWIADARVVQRRSPARLSLRVRVGAEGSTPQRRTVRLSGLDGLAAQQQQVTVDPGTFRTVEFDLPQEIALSGQVAQIDLQPNDGLNDDDRLLLNLDRTAATRVLVIEPQVTQIAELQPAFHLRTALGALDASVSGGIDVTRRAANAVLADSIRGADVIILADVPRLADGDLQALEERVRAGAGLAVFLGPSIDVEFYNSRLNDPLRPSDSLLAVTLGDAVREQRFARVAAVDDEHRLFRGLLDPVFGDLGGVQFASYFEIVDVDDGRATILADVGGQPLAVEHSYGLGRVLLFNTTASDAWSDLPRRRSFLPLLDRMLQVLASGFWRGNFEFGEAVVLPLPVDADPASVTVRSPGGKRLTPTVESIAGRNVVRVINPAESGVYMVHYRTADGRAEFPFVVQSPPQPSLPSRIDPTVLSEWWQPTSFTAVSHDPGEPLILAGTGRWMISPALLVAAALVFLLEMFFVHWLCPRANPTLSQSNISRHGFFAKSGSSAGQQEADQ